MAFSYRYLLGGNGPYESEAFDTEDEATKAAEDRGHVVEEVLSLDGKGGAQSTSRESIVIADENPAEVATVPEQSRTDGQQPA